MIKIIPPTVKPVLSKTPSEWRNSQATPSLRANGLPQEGSASDAEIAAIDEMMGDGQAPIADTISVQRGSGLRAPVAITPEQASEMMIANYCRKNGGIIADSSKKPKVILG